MICYALPMNIIARGTAIFMGICASAFLPSYFASLYWSRATKKGAIASICTGILASVFALVFLHKAESASIGICRFLFGRDVLIETYPIYMIDPIIFALPCSSFALIIGSLLDKKAQTDDKVISKTTLETAQV